MTRTGFWAESLRLPNGEGVCARGWQSLFANREFLWSVTGGILSLLEGSGSAVGLCARLGWEGTEAQRN